MGLVKSHSGLYDLLRSSEISGKCITKAEILEVTKWTEKTFDTYWRKGQLDCLTEVNENIYETSNVSRLTAIEFSKRLSQSKHRRGLGHNFKSRLARALLLKSRDNMMLALELYNRPSLENRLDGFALLFCTAWEQLLKADLIERDGEKSIYRSTTIHTKVKETIPLKECLERIFPTHDDKRRKNLEKIMFYRNAATHLLMPEIQAVVSRLFQAGVLNYIDKFEKVTEQRFLETSATGLLTLVGELRTPTVASLKSNYGSEIGNEILDLARTLEEEIKEQDDWRFAVPIDINMVFARRGKDNVLELIAGSDEGIEGLRKAIIVEKAIDRKNTHPFKLADLIIEINRRIYQRYDSITIGQHLHYKDKRTNQPYIGEYCLQALFHKLKWKNADNQFHYSSKNPEYHWYSEDAIEEIIAKIFSAPDYILNARKKYSEWRQKKGKRRS